MTSATPSSPGSQGVTSGEFGHDVRVTAGPLERWIPDPPCNELWEILH